MTKLFLNFFSLIALRCFFIGRKTISRLRPSDDIKIFGFISGIYAEIFWSNFQGFIEVFGPVFNFKAAGPHQSKVWLIPRFFSHFLPP